MAHADWSVASNKRWLSVAVRDGQRWRLRIEPVGDLDALFSRLRSETATGAALFGVDAPIGLPRAFAARHLTAHRDFPAFLDTLEPQNSFFRVCKVPAEISPERPFFPDGVSNSPRREMQVSALGIDRYGDLLRHCDDGQGRPSAASLFWTLGANQVGKGAITLWRDLLLPARRRAEKPSLWPFDGSLRELLQPGRLVVAEAYPADAMRRIGIGLRGSKRRQLDRLACAGSLRRALDMLGAVADPGACHSIETGFGSGADGEDRFDSLIGLLGMLRVLADPALDAVPDDSEIRRWEGWIIGRPPV